MLSAEQIKTLTSMSDPKKAAQLKANGLPTVDLATIKDMAQKRQELRVNSMMSDLSNSLGTMMTSVDKMIEDKLGEIEKLGKSAGNLTSNIPGKLPANIPGSGSLLGKVSGEIDALKQAREHAMSTGNFVPLFALMNPDISLKSLQKSTVVLPSIPKIG